MKLLTRLLTLLMFCSAAYGQIPITGLPPAHLPLAGTEIVPMVQGPNTVQTAVSNIFATSAPINAPYLLEAATAALANARVLSPGNNITFTDGGPGGNFTIATITNPTFAGLTLSTPLPVPSGGTGVGTLTGLALGNGTSAFSAYGGTTCTGGQVIQSLNSVGTGSCITAGAPLANPTATIGLTVINGSATTAMRSDAAPPLSQAIAPTWTGDHIFSPSSGVPVTINAPANTLGLTVNGGTNTSNTFAEKIQSGSAAGFSSGLLVQAGTNASDLVFTVNQNSGSPNFFQILGSGAGNLGPNGTNDLSWNTAGAFNIAAPTAGVGLIVNGVAGAQALDATGSSTSGQSFGLSVFAGTTNADYSVRFGNAAANTNFQEIFGDGSGFIGPNGTNNLSWTTTGDFTIATPTGNNPLIVNSKDNTTVITATDTGTVVSGIVGLEVTHGATAIGWLGSGGDSGGAAATDFTLAASAGVLNFWTNGNIRQKIDNQGRMTFNAPTATGQSDFTFNGLNGNNVLNIVQGAGAGTAFGVKIQAGSNSSDYALNMANQAANLTIGVFNGDASFSIGTNGSAAALVGATTGKVTINGPWEVNGNAGLNTAYGSTNAYASNLTGSTSRLYIGDGSGWSWNVAKRSASADTDLFRVNDSVQTGNVFIRGFGPNQAGLVDMTPDAGSTTLTYSGFGAGTVTSVAVWARSGNIVSVWLPAFTNANSNATTMTAATLVSEIQPAHGAGGVCPIAENNGALSIGAWTISGGTITFYWNSLSTGFTNVGTKGIPNGCTLAYNID